MLQFLQMKAIPDIIHKKAHSNIDMFIHNYLSILSLIFNQKI